MTAPRIMKTAAVVAGLVLAAAAEELTAGAASGELVWRRLADLPDPIGLKGMYGGSSGGQVLLAGGSNFPVPPSAGGKKVFHRAIHVRPATAGAAMGWNQAAEELPAAVGEGASVTTEQGVICVGGYDASGPIATVGKLGWNRAARRVEWTRLADLPEASGNAAAAQAGGWIYVAGGEGRRGALGVFWRLDLSRAAVDPSGARWEVLPGWPGRPRFGGILITVTTPRGERLLWGGGLSGPARSQADYLRDMFLFDPAARAWEPVAPLPRGAVLGAVVALGAGRVLVLGGSDGHDFERMRELGERYRIPSDLLLYDVRTNRWTGSDAMPLGVVGAAVVRTGDGWLVAGGEYSPGRRTPQVWEFTIRPRDDRGGARP